MKFRSKALNEYRQKKRLEAKFTQAELADLLGYTSQFVANWERGACSPPVHIFPKLVRILKIQESELLELLCSESAHYWQEVVSPGAKRGKRSMKTG